MNQDKLEQKTNKKKYFTPSELAEYLNISIHTVYLWTSTKQVPFFRLSRLTRFDKEEIDQWMKAKKIEPYKPKI
jgi:excisionase family DNA binding protein